MRGASFYLRYFSCALFAALVVAALTQVGESKDTQSVKGTKKSISPLLYDLNYRRNSKGLIVGGYIQIDVKINKVDLKDRANAVFKKILCIDNSCQARLAPNKIFLQAGPAIDLVAVKYLDFGDKQDASNGKEVKVKETIYHRQDKEVELTLDRNLKPNTFGRFQIEFTVDSEPWLSWNDSLLEESIEEIDLTTKEPKDLFPCFEDEEV